VAAATSGLVDASAELAFGIPSQLIGARVRADAAAASVDGRGNGYGTRPADETEPEEFDDGQPWHIVRKKEHPTEPMTIDDALFQMELVGHDFYLFLDKESGRPSVVYRRRAYDYGVITLAT
jgi:hypothetical protein